MPTRPKTHLQRMRAAGLIQAPHPDVRPSSTAQGYGRRWQRLRLMILQRDPLCRLCQRAPSTEVDHIKAKAKGGMDEEDNLQGLCASCHSSKTAREDRHRAYQRNGRRDAISPVASVDVSLVFSHELPQDNGAPAPAEG